MSNDGEITSTNIIFIVAFLIGFSVGSYLSHERGEALGRAICEKNQLFEFQNNFNKLLDKLS